MVFEEEAKSFFKDYYPVAYGFVRNRADAEDVLQESFVHMLKTKTFDSEKEFSTWARTVIANASKSFLRKKGRIQRESEILDYEIPEPNLRGEEYFPDEIQRLRESISGLPKKQLEAIVLRYYSWCGYDDLMVILGVSKDTLQTLLGNGVRNLKQL